jgi:hypothetical protein
MNISEFIKIAEELAPYAETLIKVYPEAAKLIKRLSGIVTDADVEEMKREDESASARQQSSIDARRKREEEMANNE